MADSEQRIERDREILARAQERGVFSTGLAYVRLSGPGWLQSAITLGGGSLAGSLYLGVLAGLTLLWLQPFFMILGIIMLSAIGYVTLSTGERPFRAINRHVNPVLGWSWAAATLMANVVWCMPQFALANSVIEQNLWPELFTSEMLGATGGKLAVSATILVVTLFVTWCYGSGHWGIRVYEWLLKLMVAGIVVSFFVVVYSLIQAGQIDLTEVAAGFVPSTTGILRPAPEIQALIDQTPTESQAFWTDRVVTAQKDKVVAAAATAVGINMTFLFPYSLLRKGWTREFRGLQKFDLATGMFIPFTLATSCILIASFARFHAQPVTGLVSPHHVAESSEGGAEANEDDDKTRPSEPPTEKETQAFYGALTDRLISEIGEAEVAKLRSGESEWQALLQELSPGQGSLRALSEKGQSEVKTVLGEEALRNRLHELPMADQLLAATLIDRDANRLAKSLAPIDSSGSSDWLFGLGVVGMTMSTITILMLISGFVICEVFNLSPTGWPFRIACSVAAVGVLGPFVWSGAGFALSVPTSVFGFMLLPIAYLTFFLLMNQRSLLKDDMPRGARRWTWNILMGIAATIATLSSAYMVKEKGGIAGIAAAGALVGLALLVQLIRWIRPSTANSIEQSPEKG